MAVGGVVLKGHERTYHKESSFASGLEPILWINWTCCPLVESLTATRMRSLHLADEPSALAAAHQIPQSWARQASGPRPG